MITNNTQKKKNGDLCKYNLKYINRYYEMSWKNKDTNLNTYTISATTNAPMLGSSTYVAPGYIEFPFVSIHVLPPAQNITYPLNIFLSVDSHDSTITTKINITDRSEPKVNIINFDAVLTPTNYTTSVNGNPSTTVNGPFFRNTGNFVVDLSSGTSPYQILFDYGIEKNDPTQNAVNIAFDQNVLLNLCTDLKLIYVDDMLNSPTVKTSRNIELIINKYKIKSTASIIVNLFTEYSFTYDGIEFVSLVFSRAIPT
jgi:hypothetical protein